MLNIIWLGLMLSSLILGAIHGLIPAVVASITESAKTAFTIALGLVGIMAFWLGLMKIAEESGLLRQLTRILQPVMRWLFPNIPVTHSALEAVTLSISANMLGLGNAATPFSLRAMTELAKLNPYPGIATDSMCMLLALNTSSVQLIPVTVIAILASNGDTNPAGIIVPILIATSLSTAVAIISAKIFARLNVFKVKQRGLENI